MQANESVRNNVVFPATELVLGGGTRTAVSREVQVPERSRVRRRQRGRETARDPVGVVATKLIEDNWDWD